MATPEALVAAAIARGANVQRRPVAAPGVGRYNREGDWKAAPPAVTGAPAVAPSPTTPPSAPGAPAWQQLRERGISGQGSAAANKATLAGMETAQPPVGAPAEPPAPEPARSVSELPMPFRSLRVGGAPTAAPPPPDAAPDGRDAGVMALRALRMGGLPREPSPILKPFETGGGAGGSGMQSVAPETPQGPPGTGFIGRPIAGSPPLPPFATEDTPPWAGLANLMAKPRFQPSGDLQQGAPDEPPQGAPGNETPPWLAGLGPFKARRPLGGLGGFGGGQSRVEPKEGSAY